MNTGIDCMRNMLIAVGSEYKTLVCNGGQGKIRLDCGDIYQCSYAIWLTTAWAPRHIPFRQACALPVPGQATRSGFG